LSKDLDGHVGAQFLSNVIKVENSVTLTSDPIEFNYFIHLLNQQASLEVVTSCNRVVKQIQDSGVHDLALSILVAVKSNNLDVLEQFRDVFNVALETPTSYCFVDGYHDIFHGLRMNDKKFMQRAYDLSKTPIAQSILNIPSGETSPPTFSTRNYRWNSNLLDTKYSFDINRIDPLNIDRDFYAYLSTFPKGDLVFVSKVLIGHQNPVELRYDYILYKTKMDPKLLCKL
jgi:hypothetical protein